MSTLGWIEAAEPQTILGPEGLWSLALFYPHVAGKFRHGLADHPLFSLDMLALAAEALPPADIECRQGDNRPGSGFAHVACREAGIGETIRDIASEPRWVMLKNIERLPGYDEVIAEIVAGIGEAVSAGGRDIGSLDVRTFLFISSPGAHTPVHFDPEHNILLQISGTKHFTTCPTINPVQAATLLERYHAHGDNLLAHDAALEQSGTRHTLKPGEALHVPFKAPHWIDVAAEPSVSLSVTWKTGLAHDQNDAWCFNGWLRQHGISPRPVAAYPARPALKANAMRLIRKVGLG